MAPETASPARVLDMLRERLEGAERLHAEMADALKRGDATAIDTATSRLETLLLEFKVLRQGLDRSATATSRDDRELDRAREAFESTAVRLARSSAISGGLLTRLVEMSRRLSAAIESARGADYMPSGRPSESGRRGLRLEETG